MARVVPCVLEGASCAESFMLARGQHQLEGAYAVCLRTLGGGQLYLAVLPTTYLAEVSECICEAFHKLKFKVQLVNLSTLEVSSDVRHQPFLQRDTLFNVVFEWVSRCRPGDYLALTDGTVGGEWPSVSSDSAVAGGSYQTPYTTTLWAARLALRLPESLRACRIAGDTWRVAALVRVSEATLTAGQVKCMLKLVRAADTNGFRADVGPLRLFLRHHRLLSMKRRHSCKTPPHTSRTNMANALRQMKKM